MKELILQSFILNNSIDNIDGKLKGSKTDMALYQFAQKCIDIDKYKA